MKIYVVDATGLKTGDVNVDFDFPYKQYPYDLQDITSGRKALRRYALDMLKSDPEITYVTCSLVPFELDDALVAEFQKTLNFEVLKIDDDSLRVYPHIHPNLSVSIRDDDDGGVLTHGEITIHWSECERLDIEETFPERVKSIPPQEPCKE